MARTMPDFHARGIVFSQRQIFSFHEWPTVPEEIETALKMGEAVKIVPAVV